MEALFVLLGLAVLALPIAVIALIVSHLTLRRETKELRASVAELRHRIAMQTPPERPIAPAQPSPEALAAENVVALSPAPKTEAQTEAPQPVRDGPRVIKPPKPEPQSVVFNSERFKALGTWLRENWFYVVAAFSLALSGIFLVQYGIETGLLTPRARIGAALGFGLLLIGAGEWIRRRFGDDAASATAYLPSVLSGAGLVSLMGAILSARLLYDLIAPGPAFAALFAITLLGLVLGWMHGALLAAIGLIGGFAAPFLVGGQSDTPEWLYAYFALLSALGLGIDSLRRWAWISALALIGGAASGLTLAILLPSDGSVAAFAAYVAGLVVLAVLIPARALVPDHQGPNTIEAITQSILRVKGRSWPIFPARLSLPTLLFACVILVLTASQSALHFWVSLSLLSGLTLLFTYWAKPAPALQDHALFSALALLVLIALPDAGAAVRIAMNATLAAQEGQTEVRMLWDISLTLCAATLVGIGAAWHSLRAPEFSGFWAGGAVLLPPLAGLALELSWRPVSLIGAWPWAFHALALAALMTWLATRYAAADAKDKTRPAIAAISALACLAFALSVVLFDAALTLALAATVAAAAALDRRFDLPLMGGYISAGIIALGVRLVFDPGLDWAISAPILQMLAGYGGTLLALIGAYWLLEPIERPRSKVFVESAILSVGGMTLSLTLYQIFDTLVGRGMDSLHWEFGLHATIWIGLTLTQLIRLQLGGAMAWLRIGLAALYALFGLGALGSGLILANPLVDFQNIAGIALFNTLIPAYLLPALALGAGAYFLKTQPLWIRLVLTVLGGATLVMWIGLSLRHGFRGSDQMLWQYGTTQPELYSYTLALLLAGAALFYQALARNSDHLRRAGVALIALVVAKVFLIDISGLQGLVRVFSFMFLGLSLAGLAWLNRWVQLRSGPPQQPPSEPDAAPEPVPEPDQI